MRVGRADKVTTTPTVVVLNILGLILPQSPTVRHYAAPRARGALRRVISVQLKHQLAIRIPHSGCTVAVLNILGLAIPPIARLKVTDVDTRVGGYRVVFAFVVWALRYV